MVRKIYNNELAAEISKRKARIEKMREEKAAQKKLMIRRGIEEKVELRELAKLEADYYKD